MKMLLAVTFLTLLVGCAGMPVGTATEPKVLGIGRTPSGTVVVRLDAPCTAHSVLHHIKEEYHASFKATRSLWRGQPFESCWIDEEGAIWLVWADGNIHRTPKGWYTQE